MGIYPDIECCARGPTPRITRVWLEVTGRNQLTSRDGTPHTQSQTQLTLLPLLSSFSYYTSVDTCCRRVNIQDVAQHVGKRSRLWTGQSVTRAREEV